MLFLSFFFHRVITTVATVICYIHSGLRGSGLCRFLFFTGATPSCKYYFACFGLCVTTYEASNSGWYILLRLYEGMTPEAFYNRGSPWIFWGSSLKELHTSPENWLQQKSKCIAAKTPMAQVYKTFFFKIKIGIPTFRGKTKNVFQKQNSGNVLPLS